MNTLMMRRRLMMAIGMEEDEVKEWSLIYDDVLREDSEKVFEIDVSGYRDFYLVVDFEKQTSTQVKVVLNDIEIFLINGVISIDLKKYITSMIHFMDGYCAVEFSHANGNTISNYAANNIAYPVFTGEPKTLAIKSRSSSDLFVSGTAAKIWAR